MRPSSSTAARQACWRSSAKIMCSRRWMPLLATSKEDDDMETAAGTSYTETRPVRRLGRALRRRRQLRVGITQLFYVLAGLALGLLLPRIHVGFTVPRAEAAQMLFAVGAGLVTFIGVVFSLLFLVVQFASTTFTPRLNLFYSAPIVWHA